MSLFPIHKFNNNSMVQSCFTNQYIIVFHIEVNKNYLKIENNIKEIKI